MNFTSFMNFTAVHTSVHYNHRHYVVCLYKPPEYSSRLSDKILSVHLHFYIFHPCMVHYSCDGVWNRVCYISHVSII
jgi:hypothetical protein